MKSYTQWLQSLIDRLNYDTLIEEPWRVEFLDQSGHRQIIGNSRVSMQKKNGLWVFDLDRERAEFPKIRSVLESAQQILQVSRRGKCEKIMDDVPNRD